LGTVYSHKMSSWLQFSAGLSVEKYIYTACISILCSIKLSGFLPLDMFQFKTYNYQHSWVSEKMCFVKCKSHNGLHKKMNTMSFLAHGLVSECSEESNVEASPDTVTVGCLTFFLWLCTDLEFVKKFTRPNFPVKEFYTLKTRKSRLFLPTINSKNTSLSVIWPSFG